MPLVPRSLLPRIFSSNSLVNCIDFDIPRNFESSMTLIISEKYSKNMNRSSISRRIILILKFPQEIRMSEFVLRRDPSHHKEFLFSREPISKIRSRIIGYPNLNDFLLYGNDLARFSINHYNFLRYEIHDQYKFINPHIYV